MNKIYLFLLTLFAAVGLANAADAPARLDVRGNVAGGGWNQGVELTKSNDERSSTVSLISLPTKATASSASEALTPTEATRPSMARLRATTQCESSTRFPRTSP